jgi:hypothetical protein
MEDAHSHGIGKVLAEDGASAVDNPIRRATVCASGTAHNTVVRHLKGAVLEMVCSVGERTRVFSARLVPAECRDESWVVVRDPNHHVVICSSGWSRLSPGRKSALALAQNQDHDPVEALQREVSRLRTSQNDSHQVTLCFLLVFCATDSAPGVRRAVEMALSGSRSSGFHSTLFWRGAQVCCVHGSSRALKELLRFAEHAGDTSKWRPERLELGMCCRLHGGWHVDEQLERTWSVWQLSHPIEILLLGTWSSGDGESTVACLKLLLEADLVNSRMEPPYRQQIHYYEYGHSNSAPATWTGCSSGVWCHLFGRTPLASLARAFPPSDAGHRKLMGCRDFFQGRSGPPLLRPFAGVESAMCECARLLVASGEPVDEIVRNSSGYAWTPLAYACGGGNVALVETLLELGAEPLLGRTNAVLAACGWRPQGDDVHGGRHASVTREEALSIAGSDFGPRSVQPAQHQALSLLLERVRANVSSGRVADAHAQDVFLTGVRPQTGHQNRVFRAPRQTVSLADDAWEPLELEMADPLEWAVCAGNLRAVREVARARRELNHQIEVRLGLTWAQREARLNARDTCTRRLWARHRSCVNILVEKAGFREARRASTTDDRLDDAQVEWMQQLHTNRSVGFRCERWEDWVPGQLDTRQHNAERCMSEVRLSSEVERLCVERRCAALPSSLLVPLASVVRPRNDGSFESALAWAYHDTTHPRDRKILVHVARALRAIARTGLLPPLDADSVDLVLRMSIEPSRRWLLGKPH